MSALSAPDAPLQIEWQPVPLQLDATGQTQLVKKPRTALQTYIPGCEPAWQDTDEISVQQFFTELQTYLQHCNGSHVVWSCEVLGYEEEGLCSVVGFSEAGFYYVLSVSVMREYESALG
ncbi:uncharacterized protein H6S33_011411 [Morchella sextelata]|uniref:uncharacterized protein n=1 Tax=Morchella sextelata TaxID=1174677 RepID=UPI001D037F6D|nr:uncharacterized protein H6S33_011411 [Morchella sextelata]KAH0610984.1 hypothetical protein H6S33_011411 [Morchella sextelata]